MSDAATVQLPHAFGFLFDPPLGGVRYRVVHGGRGSAKSWTMARSLLLHGVSVPLRILCAREYQASIRDSVHRLLEDQIGAMGIDGFYEIERARIYGRNGTEFIFLGIKRDPHTLKSTEGIDLCWVEEAEAVSEASWRFLIPTIRKPGSEIWVSFNPALPDDPTYRRFVAEPPARAIVRRVSWRDNPWLPEVLDHEQGELLKRDPEAHAHVWGGEPWMRSDSQVLAGRYEVSEFEPGEDWDGPYYGADWGFARDPTVLVRCWIHGPILYIDYDERGIGWSAAEIDRRFRRVPGADSHVIRGDAARPETIAALRELGLNVEAAPKWPGSVEDGVEHLRGYERIVIDPRCKGLIQEARLWRYKTDARTGDVLPKLRDGNDHGWDACLIAGTLVETDGGQRPIEHIRAGDRVWTRSGLRTVEAAGMTQASAEVFSVAGICGTGSHPVWTDNRGFVRLDAIRYGDILCTWGKQRSSNGAASVGGATRTPTTRRLRPTSTLLGTVISIARSGARPMVRYLRAIRSITSTRIPRTTTPTTWNASRRKSTRKGTGLPRGPRQRKLSSMRSDRLPPSGMEASRAWSGTANTASGCGERSSESSSNRPFGATSAEMGSHRRASPVSGSARERARPRGGEHLVSTTSRGSARSAEERGRSTDIPRLGAVRVNAPPVYAGKADVYNLTVADCPEYFANGVLVHNCRYALAPIIRKRHNPWSDWVADQEQEAAS